MPGGSWKRRRVLEMAARLLPTRVASLVVGELEVLDELLVGGRLLERVEVLAVQVLDQRLLEAVGIGGRAHQGGDGLQAGPLGRPPPALAGDELITAMVVGLAHQHGLEHAELPDGRGQRRQGVLVEVAPRLEGIGFDDC